MKGDDCKFSPTEPVAVARDSVMLFAETSEMRRRLLTLSLAEPRYRTPKKFFTTCMLFIRADILFLILKNVLN